MSRQPELLVRVRIDTASGNIDRRVFGEQITRGANLVIQKPEKGDGGIKL